MSWWVWVLFGLMLLGVEFISTTLHLGLFALGAFFVGALRAAGVQMPLWGELLVFTSVSLFALLVLRPILLKKLKLNVRREVDTMVGEQAIPLENIDVAAFGRAELRGTTWSARNVGETALARGQRCVVAAVDGLVLHLRAS